MAVESGVQQESATRIVAVPENCRRPVTSLPPVEDAGFLTGSTALRRYRSRSASMRQWQIQHQVGVFAHLVGHSTAQRDEK